NSAIQELIPPRFRGRTDLTVNGSYWMGAAVGGAVSLVVLDPRVINPEYGWRLAYFMGAAIGVPILLLPVRSGESALADAAWPRRPRRRRGTRDRGRLYRVRSHPALRQHTGQAARPGVHAVRRRVCYAGAA